MNQKRKSENGASLKKRGLKQWLIYMVICAVFEVLLEALIAHLGISIKPFINHLFSGFTIIGIFGLIASIVTDEDKRKIWNSLHRRQNETFWECVFLRLALFKRHVGKNWLITFALAAIFFLCVPAYAAEAGLSRNIAIHLFKIEVPKSGEPTAQEPEPESSQPLNEHSEEDEDPAKGSLAMRLIFTTQIPYTLSDTEVDMIYFLSGEYAITDWDDEGAVYACVNGFVGSLRAQHLDPSFTEEDADPNTKNTLSYASGDEANMKADSHPTSKMLEDITDRRVEVYNVYPLYPLARLIRENFGMYGDAYKLQDKSKSCAAIAYGKSIAYGFDTLRYDVSDNTLKTNLSILVERYTKLSSVLDKETFQHKAALALADALQKLSDGI